MEVGKQNHHNKRREVLVFTEDKRDDARDEYHTKDEGSDVHAVAADFLHEQDEG
jgi:hypothetical protein